MSVLFPFANLAVPFSNHRTLIACLRSLSTGVADALDKAGTFGDLVEKGITELLAPHKCKVCVSVLSDTEKEECGEGNQPKEKRAASERPVGHNPLIFQGTLSLQIFTEEAGLAGSGEKPAYSACTVDHLEIDRIKQELMRFSSENVLPLQQKHF